MKYLTIATLLLLPFFTNAQIELGFRAGANLSEADIELLLDQPFEIESMKGIHTSIFANFQLGSIFALQPELAYSQKGFEATWNNADSSYTLQTDYFELPLMIEFGFPINDQIRIFGNAGPNASYLFDAKETFHDKINNETTVSEFKFDRETELERLDLGVNFGGGISFRINRWKFIADARYNMGLLEIMAANDAGSFFEMAKNRVTNVAVGISYTLVGNKKTLTPPTPSTGRYY